MGTMVLGLKTMQNISCPWRIAKPHSNCQELILDPFPKIAGVSTASRESETAFFLLSTVVS
jgi:hypothetical protein